MRYTYQYFPLSAFFSLHNFKSKNMLQISDYMIFLNSSYMLLAFIE